MSLKAFHIFFIAMAVLISWGFPAWVWLGLAATKATAGLQVMAIGSAVLGVGLSIYGLYFIRKSRHIII